MKLNLFASALIIANLAPLYCQTQATAELVPDTSLGVENTLVAPNVDIKGIPGDRIDGGAVRGGNLFHSFREFNVGEGRGVYFANPAGIENILTRVTGGNASNILGTIGVLGNANLFLLNPNGIVFGPKARLDVGGAFYGSTASSLVFRDGLNFSAVNPQATPLLTVNIPVGLQFRGTEKGILNAGGKLEVQNGRTLALIGGQNTAPGTAGVTISAAGSLTAADGRVELGGLAGAGTVELSGNGLIFPDRTARADVFMSDRASLNVSSSGRGSIAIAARNLDITGSSLNAGVLAGLNLGGAVPGSISIDASDTVRIANSRVETDVKSGGVGNAGPMLVRAGSLSLSDGTVLLSGVRKADAQNPAGQGSGGNIAVEVRDRVSLTGSNTAIVANIGGGVTGSSGKIRITAGGSISLAEGAKLRTGTSGQGNAGQITLRAGNAVSLTGGSRIEAEVDSGAVGNGGDVSIFARSLSLTNGAALVTRASKAEAERPAGRGNAGNAIVSVREGVTLDRGFILTTVGDEAIGNSGAIAIGARSLSLSNGSRLTTATSGGNLAQRSRAGDANINVRDRVTVTGINSANPDSQTGIFATVTDRAQSGLGGDITITAGSVTVRNSGQITANSDTFQPLQTAENLRNNAGNIKIKADNIRLEERGSLAANTQAGQRAKIELNTSGLQLLRNSTITTNANNTKGGNITINSDTLVGLRNSDITANAIDGKDGKGGEIGISSQAILGLTSQTRQQVASRLTGEQILEPDFSQQFLSTSDIIAISQTDPALSGTVTIVTPDIDPASGLVELPQNLVDPAALIGQNPCEKGRESEFTITGRGGLPANPGEALNNDSVRVNLVEPAAPASSGNTVQIMLPSQPNIEGQNGETAPRIVAANGWIQNERGEVILVGYNPAGIATPRRVQTPATNGCEVRQ